MEHQYILEDAKQAELESKLEVKATPLYEEKEIKDINFTKEVPSNNEEESKPIEIERTKKNNLYGNYDYDRPGLRDYYQ